MSAQVLALPGVLEEHRESVVVFTARKSVCLADILRRLGYWQPRGDFTSNRALDGDMQLLRGRDVFIVEDLAASCRTLLSTIQAVRRGGAEKVTCFALAVEGPRLEWEKVLGVEFASPYLESHIDDSLRHARSIVDAFAVLPRPYNIDWPVHSFNEPLPLKRVTDAGWQQIASDESRADAISLEEGPALRAAARRALPSWVIEIFEASHLSKVRLYPVHSAHPKGTRVFAAPIVALGSLSGSEVASHLGALAETLGIDALEPTSTREAYRVLQFLLGDLLLHVFAVSLGIALPRRDDSAAGFLFLPGVREQVLDAQVAISGWARHISWTGTAPLSIHMLRWDDVGRAATERHMADSFLADVFLDSYVQSSEYRLRHELRTAPNSGVRERIVRELVKVDRATDGASFTAADLRDRMLRDSPDLAGIQDVRELVSGFLDRAIDAGEVVPDIDIDAKHDVASRRFRPGEIIAFERDTQAGVEAMLHSYARHTGRKAFSVDLLQKLIVGYVGYLLARGRLSDQRATGPSLGDVERLQRRYHLRGAILDEVSADFMGQQPEPEAARRLVNRGVIVPGTESGYVLSPEPVLELASGPDLDATIFGRVMADVMALRNERGARQLEEDDLGRLVTLVTPVDHVLALGADMIVAVQQMREDRSPDHLVSIAALRNAINNGLAKAYWIEEDRSKRLIGAIQKRLSDDDDIYAAAAAAVLDTLTPKHGDSSANRERRRLIDWFRDVYVWWVWARFRAGEATDEERNGRLRRDLENRAFVAIGGLRKKPRVGKARDRLRRHLIGDELLPPEEYDSILSTVQSELLDVAAGLREQCYRISSRSLGVLPRSASIETCLLACSQGDIGDAFSGITGLGPPLTPTNSALEQLLGRFNLLVPVAEKFDLASEGPALLALLDALRLEAILLLNLPERFRPFRVPEQQLATLSQPFLELVELAGDAPEMPPSLSVMMPARATSLLASAVRRHGVQLREDELLNCPWQQWSYAPPGQQLPLANSDAPPLPAAVLDAVPGTQININAVHVHNPTIDASTNIDMRSVAFELAELHQALELRSTATPEQLNALATARSDAEEGDESGVLRWAKQAGSTVGEIAKELGLEALRRLVFGG